jgi:tetratricopeptide (TPR) repeat protein
MTEEGDRRSREDHPFSAGEGFGDPYEGFDFDPAELSLELDPTQIDPTDTHVLPDLLDEAAIPRDAVDASELVDVGLAYMGINRFEQAADTFERAARFASDETTEQEAWTNKGTAHAELEEWDAAIGAFEEAIHVAPEGEHAATAETNLANALWEFGRDDAALEHAERAVEKDERFAEAWYNRGFFLNERGLPEQALESLENAIRLGYRDADVLEEKRRALEALGEYDEAEAVAEEVEALRAELEQNLVE